MQGPSFSLSTDDEDDVLEVKRNDFGRPNFSIPSQNRPPILSGSGGGDFGADMLINKRKVSGDVVSMASGSASISASSSEASSESGSEVETTDEDVPDIRSGGQYGHGGHQNTPVGYGGGNDYMGQRIASERARVEQEMNEKKELLYQMDRLESKGYRLPKKFTMQSDLEEMRSEYHRILREKEVDASIRFQRKMLMACVTGIEFLNTRFDPFDVHLDGWSEQVHENITDYDDIFEELHEKYKNSGRKMAPELRLLMSLSGSAFMFHLTNSMFKQSPLPSVEAVLRSNPELFRQFQQTAAQSYAGQAGGGAGAAMAGMAGMMGGQGRPGGGAAGMGTSAPSGGLFGMMGNLFGNMNAPSAQAPQATAAQKTNIDSIINDIHRDIIAPTNQTAVPSAQTASQAAAQAAANRIETMSISDEEITSIIEDTADMAGILSNGPSRTAGRRRGGSVASGGASVAGRANAASRANAEKRTLNL